MLKFFTILGLLFCNIAFANPIIGNVVDGDTMDVLINTPTIENLITRIRFKCSDTPECGKSCRKKGKSEYIGNIDIGFESLQFVKRWLDKHNYTIELKCVGLGKYNRSECYVIANNENLNHLLIQNGYAVASKKYCNEDELKMMEVAKQNKKGFWGMGWNEMPSEFRNKNKK